MATSATSGRLIPISASNANTVPMRRKCRRRIDPQAGRALEILGHAIEYLADEFVEEQPAFSACHPQLEAIQMLMAVNRRIYLECPEIPGWRERFRSLLRIPTE